MAVRKSKVKARTCAACSAEFNTGTSDRFCVSCRKAKRAELKESGYLTPMPFRMPGYSTNNFDPHRDEDDPDFENGVRAVEDN